METARSLEAPVGLHIDAFDHCELSLHSFRASPVKEQMVHCRLYLKFGPSSMLEQPLICNYNNNFDPK